jgi:putative transcriptional regulator
MTPFTGQLLVAMPQMQDDFFHRSVVYLCAHSRDDGAMGLIINKPLASPTIDELYAHLKIEPAASAKPPPSLCFGGPVGTDKSFVLHSADYCDEGTLRIDHSFAMTATLDILRAMAKGAGPDQWLMTVGYAGWAPGQLEAEIQANGWLLVVPDLALVFDSDNDRKWQRALAKIGVSPESLSASSGRA